MEEFFTYYPVVLGFILNVSGKNLPKVKDQLVYAVAKLEADDRGYIFNLSNLNMLKNPCPVAACISDYTHEEFDLAAAITQVVYLMGCEDYDAHKYIFVILDQYENQDYQIASAFRLDLANDYRCNFIFVSLKDHLDLCYLNEKVKHPRFQYINLNINDLGKTVLKIYKE